MYGRKLSRPPPIRPQFVFPLREHLWVIDALIKFIITSKYDYFISAIILLAATIYAAFRKITNIQHDSNPLADFDSIL